MTATELPGFPKRACWSCGGEISSADNYCRFCGKGQGEHLPWQYKHWGIVVLTLVGLGPFSLYYVWRSPLLSRETKLFYTTAIAGATLFAAHAFYKVWQYYMLILGGGLTL